MLKELFAQSGLTLEGDVPDSAPIALAVQEGSNAIDAEYDDGEKVIDNLVALEALIIDFTDRGQATPIQTQRFQVACEGFFKNLTPEMTAVDPVALASGGLVKTGSLDQGYGLSVESFRESARQIWEVVKKWWASFKTMIKDWWARLWDVEGRTRTRLIKAHENVHRSGKHFRDGITIPESFFKSHCRIGWGDITDGRKFTDKVYETGKASHYIFNDYMKEMEEFTDSWVQILKTGKDFLGRDVIKNYRVRHPRAFGFDVEFKRVPYMPKIMNTVQEHQKLPKYKLIMMDAEESKIADVTIDEAFVKLCFNATVALLDWVSGFRKDWRAKEERLDRMFKAAEAEFNEAMKEFGATTRTMTFEQTAYMKSAAQLVEAVPRQWCSFVMRICNVTVALLESAVHQAKPNTEKDVNGAATVKEPGTELVPA